jgi:DNA polymerase III epsilon subunit-like protein
MSILWAKSVLRCPLTAFMDTETTAVKGYVCEIAIRDNYGHMLYQSLVNPQTPIEDGATTVHGITNGMVAGAPVFADIWDSIAVYLNSPWVVAWNAPFDFGMVNKELARMEYSPLKDNWHCAMRQYGAFRGDIDPRYNHYRWWKLEGGHRAAGDCLAMIDRVIEMARG